MNGETGEAPNKLVCDKILRKNGNQEVCKSSTKEWTWSTGNSKHGIQLLKQSLVDKVWEQDEVVSHQEVAALDC